MRYIKETKLFDEGDGMYTAVIYLSEKMEVLGSTILNGGNNITDTLFIMQVPHDYHHQSPLDHAKSIRDKHGLPEDSCGFMTAAEVKYVFSVAETEFEREETFVAATAGLSNQVVAGDVLENWEERHKLSLERAKMLHAGTINIIGVVSEPLTDAAKINLLCPMVEAKTVALNSLGYKETGTTSDAIALVSPIGDNKVDYTGTGTPIGISMARSVKAAVRESLEKRGDYPYMGDIEYQLKLRGITRDDMWNAAMEIYDPNPYWKIEDVRAEYDRKFDILCKDINVASLVQAAMMLEDLGEKDCICAMPRGMYETDPIHLIADEIIGMQLAQYIAGTRGIFQFHQYDRYKPGIIKTLGPFMDDMICGLLGGIISFVFTSLFDKDD